MGLPNATSEKVTGDLCYRANFAQSPAAAGGESEKS